MIPRAVAATFALASVLGACVETAVLGTLPPDGSTPTKTPEGGAGVDGAEDAPDAERGGDAGGGGRTCASNADCEGTGGFCRWPDGQCRGAGACAPRPTSCGAPVALLCACDDTTLAGRCELAMAGANVLGPAPCPPQPKLEGGTRDAHGPPGD